MTVVQEVPVYTVPVAVEVRRPSGFMVFLQSLASFVLRFALALPFWKSGLTKWEAPLVLAPSTNWPLASEAQLHVPSDLGRFWIFDKAVAMPYAEIVTWALALGEILIPAALVIGFATRLSGLGALLMTALMFLAFPNMWQTETLPWAALALALVAYGPGRLSFDYLIWEGFRRR